MDEVMDKEALHRYLCNYKLNLGSALPGSASPATVLEEVKMNGLDIPFYINEFWTPRQRKASSLHEVSYRACFKPQLPGFFIELLTQKGEVVYDPFMGRGTTLIEAALRGRLPYGNDINPLSRIFAEPRLCIPSPGEVKQRLEEIPFSAGPPGASAGVDLSMFYHPGTEAELVALRNYLGERKREGKEDRADRWIRMVATTRLTGHSPGFFSVYTLPPNQAVSPERQKLINRKYNQEPPYRKVKNIIYKKSCSLLSRVTPEQLAQVKRSGEQRLLLCTQACRTPEISSGSVQLTVTSPPFLDVVQYSQDNWLRCWFNHIEAEEVEKGMTMARKIDEWVLVMERVFKELYRVTSPGGWVAFEVGEVKKGKINLEEQVIPAGTKAGFKCLGVLINRQQFTKTSNIWGVNNNRSGTNTNRVVIFHKQEAVT